MREIAALYLDRLTFGPRPGEVAALESVGLGPWLDAQLSPPYGDDRSASEALLAATLPIAYTDAEGNKINERRPLTTLGLTQSQLWPLQSSTLTPIGALRARPAQEVQAASLLRAVHADYQLREVLVQFWHNHFNVNSQAYDQIGVSYPAFDRDAIRPNALGNFASMLTATARSTSMLYYLNQEASHKRAPNENYARELLELHTLGIDAYGGRGTTTSETPDSTRYTDQDVRDVARALSGWTVANGYRTDDSGQKPNDGTFIFSQALHDDTVKRPFGVAMGQGTIWRGRTEGDLIMTILAASPATARHLSTKLCRLLVTDQPPAALVERVARVWSTGVHAPDQIAQVVRAIVTSPEFLASSGAKLKNPLRLMAGYLRGTQMPWAPSSTLISRLVGMGFRLHTWPAPNGMPDVATAWSGVNGLMQRWNMLSSLLSPTGGVVTGTLTDRTPTGFTQGRQVVDHWANALLQGRLQPDSRAALIAYAESSSVLGSASIWRNPGWYENGLRGVVSAIAATPEFQYG